MRTREKARDFFSTRGLKMRLKALIPSLREKKRYIGFEAISEQEVSFGEAKEAIISSFKAFAGDLGVAKAGLIFLKDWKNGKGIARVSTKEVETFKAALALVRTAGGKKVVMKSFAVSGVLDKIRKKILKKY